MFTIKELLDGMECFFRFTHHSEERMVERMICYDDVVADCQAAAEELLSLKEGSEVNIVNTVNGRMIAVALNNDDDYNLYIDIKTVIDSDKMLKKLNYIIINNKEDK